jgi:hypothetical protein
MITWTLVMYAALTLGIIIAAVKCVDEIRQIANR